MKQILATFPLRNFLRVFALVAVVSATSCSKDPAVDGELHGDMLRFAVAEADGWNTQLRCGAAESEEKSAVSPENVAEVFSLRGENPADTLFLHASVADGIAAPYPNVQTDRLQTRATPVETGTFYDSFGVLASVYTGTWSEDSCLPDYMYDVEVSPGRPPITGPVPDVTSVFSLTRPMVARGSFFRIRRRPVLRRSPIRSRQPSPTSRICWSLLPPGWPAIPLRRLR